MLSEIEGAPAELVAYARGGVPVAGGAFDRGRFFVCFAGVARRARGVAAGEQSLAQVLRVGMLSEACAVLSTDEHVGLVREAYEKGDSDEKIAVLRALSLLPAAERFVDIANEACRSNVLEVFTAIACENAYPARCFSELIFNQMVMKAYFLDVRVARILGLDERKNAELARMASDFSAERRAAGRPVPPDLGLVLEGQRT